MGIQKITTEEIIERFVKVHGDKFDYSKVVYSPGQKVIIICPKHKEFLIRPDGHIKSGCPQCNFENCLTTRALNIKEAYVEKIIEYKNEFIDKANIVHNSFYNYDFVDYKNSKTKVNILCPTHGIYAQTPDSHLRGCGCYQCGRLKTIEGSNGDKATGFSKSSFKKKCKNNEGVLYIVLLSQQEEQFVKIGITGKSTTQRNISEKKYNITIKLEIYNTPEQVYDLEDYLHVKLEKYKYLPKIKFDGYTECFTLEALNHLPELLQNNPIIKINESISCLQ